MNVETRLGRILAFGMAFLALTACHTPSESPDALSGRETAMALTSPAFEDGSDIPAVYTCDGEDRSPPLSWDEVPEETVTLALIVDDPDAPVGTFVHWVIYSIPKEVRALPAGIPSDPAGLEGTHPDLAGVRQGRNGFGDRGYGGPCPPGGTHRYVFRLYALDTELALDPDKADKQALLEAMEGHILATTTLTGQYRRQR